MENDNLALELLTQMKTTIKRLFVVVLLLTFLLFATNIAWLYYWNIPSEKYNTAKYHLMYKGDLFLPYFLSKNFINHLHFMFLCVTI